MSIVGWRPELRKQERLWEATCYWVSAFRVPSGWRMSSQLLEHEQKILAVAW